MIDRKEKILKGSEAVPDDATMKWLDDQPKKKSRWARAEWTQALMVRLEPPSKGQFSPGDLARGIPREKDMRLAVKLGKSDPVKANGVER
ncbi:unnamed protein product [Dovyalis caffra]|uniref:Uncharacterized protein n=1 Tax=Dovyalis caffra TaxID=77055 RepID=A0AAV1S671_9ROSI|nr:unnamed protein product [Dovyalis caffra]